MNRICKRISVKKLQRNIILVRFDSCEEVKSSIIGYTCTYDKGIQRRSLNL